MIPQGTAIQRKVQRAVQRKARRRENDTTRRTKTDDIGISAAATVSTNPVGTTKLRTLSIAREMQGISVVGTTTRGTTNTVTTINTASNLSLFLRYWRLFEWVERPRYYYHNFQRNNARSVCRTERTTHRRYKLCQPNGHFFLTCEK